MNTKKKSSTGKTKKRGTGSIQNKNPTKTGARKSGGRPKRGALGLDSAKSTGTRGGLPVQYRIKRGKDGVARVSEVSGAINLGKGVVAKKKGGEWQWLFDRSDAIDRSEAAKKGWEKRRNKAATPLAKTFSLTNVANEFLKQHPANAENRPKPEPNWKMIALELLKLHS